MKTLFKDYKETYDIYVAEEKDKDLEWGLKYFAKFAKIDYSFACLIHFIMETSNSAISYEHMWVSPNGAILWTKLPSPTTYIAKWIAPNGEYSDYCNGVCYNIGDIISDIEFYDNIFENINKDKLIALKILVEALDLDVDIY